MKLNYDAIVKRFRQSSEQWIMPIPVIEDGKLKVFCFMNHDKENRIADDKPIWFDSYYSYQVSLLVLHNFLMEKSCGQAYWKYVRSKKPRTSFLGLDDYKRNNYFSESSIKQIMMKGRSDYIFDLINDKFDDIDYDFTTESKTDDDDLQKEIDELKDMGYDY